MLSFQYRVAMSAQPVFSLGQIVQPPPQQPVEADHKDAHQPDAQHDARPVALRRGLRRYRSPGRTRVSVVLPHDTSSETMLAFQAPPEAVIAPVTQEPKMPGRDQGLHARALPDQCWPPSRARSFGMPCAPPITLNSRYHCAPKRHQQDAAPVQADAERDESQRREREQKVGGKRGQNLHDRLRDARQLRG